MTSALPAAGLSALPPLNIPKPKKTKAWALVESEFEEGLVGGKAGNLAKLRGKLPAGVSSAALILESCAGQAAGQAACKWDCRCSALGLWQRTGELPASSAVLSARGMSAGDNRVHGAGQAACWGGWCCFAWECHAGQAAGQAACWGGWCCFAWESWTAKLC